MSFSLSTALTGKKKEANPLVHWMPSFVGLLFLLQCGESGILTENIIPRTGAKTVVPQSALFETVRSQRGSWRMAKKTHCEEA